MLNRREPEQYAPKGKKLTMHPCHRQGLYGTRFVQTANKALQGELTLLSFRGKLLMEPAPGQEAN